MSMNSQLKREIKLGERSHRLVFGRLPELGREMSDAGLSGKALVVSHPRIMKLHGKALIEGLGEFKTNVCEIPEGEESKSETGLAPVLEACNRNRLERYDTIVCFGGGVIGDLGGYAAANWSRGVNVVQVPTTLIAQVDSSIGGKTGIDWKGIKNKIGAFKQPRLIFTDSSVLSTLPERHFRNGMAEVVKYGLLNAEFWNGMDIRKDLIRARDPKTVFELVWRCANIKCDYVEQDEFDQNGERAKLNLGHTIGHGIEAASAFRMLHGESVSLGLIGMAKLSAEMTFFGDDELPKLKGMLRHFGLPTKLNRIDRGSVIELMYSDKKVKDGVLRFVLLNRIGTATFPYEIGEGKVREALACL